jgi:subtilisin family serine protease
MIRRSLTLATLTILAASALIAAEPRWQDKVDPWVLDTGRAGYTEFLVVLADQAELGSAAALSTKAEKGAFVFRALTAAAERSQAPVLASLRARGVEVQPFWVVNMIWVRGDLATVEAMARRSDVKSIHANPQVRGAEPLRVPADDPDGPDTVEWNILRVNADDVWAAGTTGVGAVIGGQDTGYLWNHAALINQYRGGPAGNHDYNWHDAIHSGGGACGPNSPVPCDDYGHGTHTMGTMVGDDGAGNQVGMAPGAKWIGCRNMDVGVGTPATYAECYQWFLAPTTVAGSNPDPSMAPDVINNSWGCPTSEGCTDPNVLLGVVQAVRAAGIVTVHSAGNDGSSCSSVSTPAAIYAESFSVGATDSGDTIAYFSSRGPVTVDGSNRRKPDVSAPGVNIRSSTYDGGYQGGWSGTSMAGPHVAGEVALLISHTPGLAGQVDLIEDIIEQTSVPYTTSEGCGGDPTNAVPNNTYGWGRIDAWAASNYPLPSGGLPFSDGFETGSTSAWSATAP